jgi:ABC-2 type transport system ATP-binding protein
VLLTTHELAEAERMADRLVVIDGGHLVAAGTLDELAAISGPAAVRWTTSPGAATSDLARRLGAPIREERPGQYVAETAGDPATVAVIAGWLSEQGLPLGALRAGLPALEDIYLRLTGGGRDQGTTSPATGRPRGRADG